MWMWMWMWVCCLWMLDARGPGCRMMGAAAKTVGNQKLGARSDVRNLPIPLPEPEKAAWWLGWESPLSLSRTATSSDWLLPFSSQHAVVSMLSVPVSVRLSCYSQLEVEASTHPPPQLYCTVTQHLWLVYP
ncbi:hypothetical protein BDP81DRAFT_421299 [Colletotrichum phormii]|uniref:Secreted protein n=1 Tax=Colletotrichum phormii TaxID=359342 RepID=A0AAI9ZZT3_9PEZI|nr:uncharacterized protein BDP81DRAFT_421299 [Colletotrichum phormii]KAK1639557.1 hypothetical protein BDP81DRAFT_421299 [Colletotrichum phormii]